MWTLVVILPLHFLTHGEPILRGALYQLPRRPACAKYLVHGPVTAPDYGRVVVIGVNHDPRGPSWEGSVRALRPVLRQSQSCGDDSTDDQHPNGASKQSSMFLEHRESLLEGTVVLPGQSTASDEKYISGRASIQRHPRPFSLSGYAHGDKE